MYSLVFYVPETHLERVKRAIFEVGAGAMGDYDSCCWQIKGQGQFRPLNGADPHIGKVGALEKIDEYRVEVVIEDERRSAVIAALLSSHPYEEVAYHLIEVQC